MARQKRESLEDAIRMMVRIQVALQKEGVGIRFTLESAPCDIPMRQKVKTTRSSLGKSEQQP